MADKNAEVAVEDNGGMKKTLSLWNFFTIGFGAIIGTGWVLQVGDWMVVGGGPVPAMIAFLLGAIFLVPVGAVFGELTAAIPISGGIVEYVDRSFGRTMSYITGWLLALGNGILCPWEAIAISTLVSELFGSLPGLEWLRAVKLYTILGADVYLFPTLIALGFATYVIFLNFRGGSSDPALRHATRHGRLAVHRLAGQRHARVLPGHRCWRRQARYRGHQPVRRHRFGPGSDPVLLRRLRHHSSAG